MQQSIFAQAKSVAVQRGAQVNSLVQQRRSLMKQAQAASPAFMPPSDNPDTIPTMPSEPIVQADLSKIAVKSPVFAMLDRMRKLDDSGFILPWDQPKTMTMPNVRVPSTACPALADDEIDKLSESAGQKNSVAPELIAAIMRQESGFRPCAVSTAGAMGLMQLMPETVQTLGVDDPFAPEQNVEAGAKYLKQLLDRYHGDRRLALSAYNAGPGRLDQANGVPDIPETQDYVERILSSLGEP
jgi:soluble lytic murein transglycosylase-like protein